MKILRNYILKQLAGPLLMSVVTLTFIFLLGNIVKIAELILNRGVDFFELLQFLGFLIPEMLTFTLPTSLLASILLVFGDLSQHNEINAIRASGVNIVHVMFPVIAIGMLLSVSVLVISDQVLPEFSIQSRKAIKRLFFQDPIKHLKEGVPTKILDQFVIVARQVDGEELKNVTVYQPQEGKPTRTILAERCRIEREKRNIKIVLFDGSIDEPDDSQETAFHKLDFDIYELPLLDMAGVDDVGKKTREYRIDEMLSLLRSEDLDEETRLGYQVEIHKKLSFALGCFLFTLVGMPVAVITRRGNALVSFALAVGFLTFYYGLYSWAQIVALQGGIPPEIALWVPSAIFFVVGCVLTRRVIRI